MPSKGLAVLGWSCKSCLLSAVRADAIPFGHSSHLWRNAFGYRCIPTNAVNRLFLRSVLKIFQRSARPNSTQMAFSFGGPGSQRRKGQGGLVHLGNATWWATIELWC